MPKLKSHSGAKKRFKRTATGKIMRRRAGRRHILTSKTRRQKRSLRQKTQVSPGMAARIERMLL